MTGSSRCLAKKKKGSGDQVVKDALRLRCSTLRAQAAINSMQVPPLPSPSRISCHHGRATDHSTHSTSRRASAGSTRRAATSLCSSSDDAWTTSNDASFWLSPVSSLSYTDLQFSKVANGQKPSKKKKSKGIQGQVMTFQRISGTSKFHLEQPGRPYGCQTRPLLTKLVFAGSDSSPNS